MKLEIHHEMQQLKVTSMQEQVRLLMMILYRTMT